MANVWKALTGLPAFSADTMILLTDGSVLVHDFHGLERRQFLVPPNTRCKRALRDRYLVRAVQYGQ